MNAREWPRTFTTELLDLINVLSLCVELEPKQAALLNRVCTASMITVADLEEGEVFPVPTSACKAPSPRGSDQLELL